MPALQSVNYQHILPTRYALELESLKGVVAPETFKEVSTREDSKKAIKKAFEERYLAGKNKCVTLGSFTPNPPLTLGALHRCRWFFTPLRF